MNTLTMGDTVFRRGQNAADNWKLLDKAADEDIFFHLRSFSSCFVIMSNGDVQDQKHLYTGASLCKSGTKYRAIPNLKVEYCPCSNVRKTKNVGEVEYIRKRAVGIITV